MEEEMLFEGCRRRLRLQTAVSGDAGTEQILPLVFPAMRNILALRFFFSSRGETIHELVDWLYRVDGEEEVGKWLN
jgi:hypothetical protein